MTGKEFPIKIYAPTFTATNSGGKTENYSLLTNDFAEVSDKGYSKYNNDQGKGQEATKVFKIDYRPSLALTATCLIEFDSVQYTILTIAKEKNKKFQYIVEAKAKS